MKGTHWIEVEAAIVECFQTWGEPSQARHPWFEIEAEIGTGAGGVQRVTGQQRLRTYTHHWRPPDPGDIVPARWDPAHRRLRLELGGDPRYDERLIKRLGRTREAPTWTPFGTGGAG